MKQIFRDHFRWFLNLLLLCYWRSPLISASILKSKDCVKGHFLQSHIVPQCQCYKNWEGIFCNIPICKNGGRSNLLRSAQNTSIRCECPDNYIGTHCELPLCREGFLKDGKCSCMEGYGGTFCEVPCLHGDFDEKAYVCKCHAGFAAPRCDECEEGRGGRGCSFIRSGGGAFLWVSIIAALILLSLIAVILLKFGLGRKSRRRRGRRRGEEWWEESHPVLRPPTPHPHPPSPSPPGYSQISDIQTSPLLRLGPPPSYSEISLVAKSVQLGPGEAV